MKSYWTTLIILGLYMCCSTEPPKLTLSFNDDVLTCNLRLRMIPESSMVPVRDRTCGRLSCGFQVTGGEGGDGGGGEGSFFIGFQ